MKAKEKILIVSPHPDDACFSLGGFILKNSGEQIIVWDVFSLQEYSIDGSKDINAKDTIVLEEQTAMSMFGVDLIMEGLPEAGLRGYRKLSGILNYSFTNFNEKHIGEKVFTLFNRVAEEVRPDVVLIPLGCGGHVDHLITREFVVKWLREKQNKIKLFLYEELPYGLNKDWVKKALDSCNYTLQESFAEIDGFIDEKAKIMSVYKSQIKDREIQAIVKHSGSIKQGHQMERIWQVLDKAL